jgi:hypothetical protein
MSLLDTGRSELLQANLLNKSATDIANARQAQKSSLEYQNDIANNNRNGAIAGSAVNLGIAYAGYKHDQEVREAKGLANREALGSSGGMNNSATGNSISNSDIFRSGTGDQSNGAGGSGGIVGSDAGGQTFNAQLKGTTGGQGLSGSTASGNVVGSNAGGNAYDNGTGGGYNTANPGSNIGSSTGSAASGETTQSLNTDVTNSSSAGTSSGENSGGSSGGGGAAGAVAIVGGLYQLFNSIF